MKQRIPMTDFNCQWARQVTQSTSVRMKDDQVEQDFWKSFMARKNGHSPDASSRQVVAWMLPLLRKYQIETALEFGPGWGNYTIDLAKCCRELDCVDISKDVLDFILKIGQEKGCTNIGTFHTKWEEFTPQRKYDLVFGYNCFYRQSNLADCLRRMNDAADKLCIVGMNTGLAPLWAHELEEAGCSVRWEWKDYFYFAGTLYQMGIDPNVTILPFTKELSYTDIEALIQGECRRLAPDSDIPDNAMEILSRHFQQQENGSWQASLSLRSGIVWWKPQVF